MAKTLQDQIVETYQWDGVTIQIKHDFYDSDTIWMIFKEKSPTGWLTDSDQWGYVAGIGEESVAAARKTAQRYVIKKWTKSSFGKTAKRLLWVHVGLSLFCILTLSLIPLSLADTIMMSVALLVNFIGIGMNLKIMKHKARGMRTPYLGNGLKERGVVDEVEESFRAWKNATIAIIDGKASFYGLSYGNYGVVADSECSKNPDHRAPVPECSCGFHGWKDKNRAYFNTLLEVDFSGRVCIHKEGYRAEHQEVLSVTFYGVCAVPSCYEASVWLTDDQVAGESTYGLQPICNIHKTMLDRRTQNIYASTNFMPMFPVVVSLAELSTMLDGVEVKFQKKT